MKCGLFKAQKQQQQKVHKLQLTKQNGALAI